MLIFSDTVERFSLVSWSGPDYSQILIETGHILTPIDLTFAVFRLHHVVSMCIMLYKCHILTFPLPMRIEDAG